MKYFIRDCNNKIVGNKNGYKTFKGANTQANNHRMKINKMLWETFDNRENKECMLVSTINQDKP